MPAAEKASPPRFVVDESSFDFRELSDSAIEEHLFAINESLSYLVRGSGGVSVSPMWDAVECLDGCELYQFLSGEKRSQVDRDILSLAFRLLSRCPEWDSFSTTINETVTIGGEDDVLALSVGFALAMALQRHSVGCLVFSGSTRDGYLAVDGRQGSAEIFFFCHVDQLPTFWRRVIEFERVPETVFFELAENAFPALLLHPGLSFRRFDGAYLDLRTKVVDLLAAINDHFPLEYRARQGRPYDVQAAMGSHGADVSPESPNTRKSGKMMRQRDVNYNGEVFRCEWHAKLKREINRIHFSEPNEKLGGKILIWIFVSHLDT